MGLLDSQVAFITGAGKGIGRVIALRFAAEGAKVAVTGRNEANLNAVCEEIRLAGGTAHPIMMDLCSEESIVSAVAQASAALGSIDVLVNNAAIIALHTITDTPTDVWDEVMNTNIRGLFLTCRAVLPDMIKHRTGRIINIGSMAGRRAYAEQGAYCASKHALVGFNKVLAVETQKYGIRVHLLSPGGVLTELSHDLRASRNEPDDSPEWMTSKEVAEAALYLCSQNGAAFTDELILRRFASEPWR